MAMCTPQVDGLLTDPWVGVSHIPLKETTIRRVPIMISFVEIIFTMASPYFCTN